jgi:hypothetical protein
MLSVTMLAVTFRASDGRKHEASVPRHVALRDLQRGLCTIFGASFPSMQANIQVGGRLCDEFDHVPFAGCACRCESPPRDPHSECACGAKAEACVTFERAADFFWFDWADRRQPKCTLEEEVAYDDALRLGSTSLNLCAWLRSVAPLSLDLRS